jgi:hypothetical protein
MFCHSSCIPMGLPFQPTHSYPSLGHDEITTALDGFALDTHLPPWNYLTSPPSAKVKSFAGPVHQSYVMLHHPMTRLDGWSGRDV